MQKLFKQMSNKPSTLIELDSTSTSSSSSSSSAVSAVMDAIEIAGSDSDSDSTQEINFDEKIRGKEKAIREVDLYITKLQDRRKQLFDECNKLKDQKALRQSNELAKQNWDSGEYRWCSKRKFVIWILLFHWFQMHFHGTLKFIKR